MADIENEEEEIEVDVGCEGQEKENNETKAEKQQNESNTPPSDSKTSKRLRAERFGLPLSVDKSVDAKSARKTRFGIQTTSEKRKARMDRFADTDPEQKRKKQLSQRAQRFGDKRKLEGESIEKDLKKQKREERFGPLKPTSPSEKRKSRKQRFSLPNDSLDTSNGNLTSSSQGAKGTQSTTRREGRLKRFAKEQ